MIPQTNTRPKKHTGRRWLVAILLAGSLVRAAWHFTAKNTLTPAQAQALVAQNPVTAESTASDTESVTGESILPAATFAPFLNIVPSEDGTELFISASGVGELGGTAFVNVGAGPGHDKDSWTMAYSNTVQAYVATATGFTPNTGASGPLNITTTLGLDTGVVDFNRAYVPASTIQTISSVDGNLELTLVSTDTINHDTYIAVVPSYAPPGPAALGHRVIGSSYSVRAAGALLVTDRPMSLRLHYNETTLAGADPHTLAIFAWDAFNKQWTNLNRRLFPDQGYLAVTTSRLTTYALMATPTWRDDFDDFSGLNLAQASNVTLGLWEGYPELLVLASAATTGTAVSKPITPTTTVANWGDLTFTCTVDPPTTTLTVDVLSLNRTRILSNVASGVSLSGIDPVQYPALKLQANLSSTVVGQTPALDEWQLTWQAENHKIYLPMVLK